MKIDLIKELTGWMVVSFFLFSFFLVLMKQFLHFLMQLKCTRQALRFIRRSQASVRKIITSSRLLLSEVRASWQIEQFDLAFVMAKRCSGLKSIWSSKFLNLNKFCTCWAIAFVFGSSLGVTISAPVVKWQAIIYMTFSSALMSSKRRFVDVGGSTFLEHNFTSLELLI